MHDFTDAKSTHDEKYENQELGEIKALKVQFKIQPVPRPFS